MRCPESSEWDLLSMSLLDEPRSAELRTHASECTPCGEAECDAERAHGELLRLYAGDRGRLRSRDELLARLPVAGPPAGAGGSEILPAACAGGSETARYVRQTIGVRFMKSLAKPRVGAIGVAAAVIIAVGAFVYSERPSVAWAEVAKRIEGVKSVVATLNVVDPKQGDAVVSSKKLYMSEAEGLRTDTFTQSGELFEQEFALPKRAEWVTIVHDTKEFGAGHFEVRPMDRTWRRSVADTTPASWAAALLNLRNLEHARELPATQLDGRPTAVFRVRDVTIYVDVQVKLPVRMVAEGEQREVYESITWDAPIAVEVFEPTIPDGLADKTPPEPSTPEWFEKVLGEMRLRHAIQYETRTMSTINGQTVGPVMNGRRYFSSVYGVRTEWYQNGQLMSVEIYNRAQNRGAWIGHPTKTYDARMFKPGEEKKGGWNLTPDQWLEGFARLAKDPSHEALERTVIGGRAVRGFEFRAEMPKQHGGGERVDRYWIDEEALLPARCEHDAPAGDGRRIVMVEENFSWNPALDAKLFEIEIPEGYRSIQEKAAPEAEGGEAPEDR